MMILDSGLLFLGHPVYKPVTRLKPATALQQFPI